MPENLPAAKPLEALRERSQVLPVPIAESSTLRQQTAVQKTVPQRIVWNHRWEYDKNPDDFFAVLFALSDAGVAKALSQHCQLKRHPGIA